MYPPLALTSRPGSTLVRLGIGSSGILKIWWNPFPVMLVSVSGNSPCRRVHSARLLCPSAPSTSRTTIPDSPPVAAPQFASGQVLCQSRICDICEVALFFQFTRGCFPMPEHLGSQHEHPSPTGLCKGHSLNPNAAMAMISLSLSADSNGFILNHS